MVATSLQPGSLAGGVLLTIHRLSQGGADRVAMLLANGLAAAGVPTAVAVLRDGGEAEATLLGMLRDDVAVVSAGPPMGSRHLELVRGLRHIQRVISHARPSVVLASSSNMGLVTGLCARLQRSHRPGFVMKLTNPVLRPNDHDWLYRLYRRRLYRFIFGSYDRVLILSDAERVHVTRLFPAMASRLATVPNPYVTETMLAEGPPRPQASAPTLLCLARMMPQKRLDRLLDAFALIGDRSARLVILGDGPERAALLRQADVLGITGRIDMPGFVVDVEPWLRRADLLVLASDYEGLPAVVFEALACGVPVVTTDSFAAARDLLDDLPGCAVVDRTDVAGMARAIDASLAVPCSAADLRDVARPYGFDAAIAAHVAMIKSRIGPPTKLGGGIRQVREPLPSGV